MSKMLWFSERLERDLSNDLFKSNISLEPWFGLDHGLIHDIAKLASIYLYLSKYDISQPFQSSVSKLSVKLDPRNSSYGSPWTNKRRVGGGVGCEHCHSFSTVDTILMKKIPSCLNPTFRWNPNLSLFDLGPMWLAIHGIGPKLTWSPKSEHRLKGLFE